MCGGAVGSAICLVKRVCLTMKRKFGIRLIFTFSVTQPTQSSPFDWHDRHTNPPNSSIISSDERVQVRLGMQIIPTMVNGEFYSDSR